MFQMCLLFTVWHWVLCLVYVALDVFQTPRILYQYKCVSVERIERDKWLRTSQLVVFNQVVVSGVWFIGIFQTNWFRDLPVSAWVWHFPVFLVMEEVGFYYGHRLLHQTWWCTRVHHIHHEWDVPVALSTLYAHPVEHILTTILPLTLGPIVMRTDPRALVLWVVGILLCSYAEFEFPFWLSPSPHFEYH